MYKKDRLRQMGLTDFNQLIGLKMNQENRWVKSQMSYPGMRLRTAVCPLAPDRIPETSDR